CGTGVDRRAQREPDSAIALEEVLALGDPQLYQLAIDDLGTRAEQPELDPRLRIPFCVIQSLGALELEPEPRRCARLRETRELRAGGGRRVAQRILVVPPGPGLSRLPGVAGEFGGVPEPHQNLLG